MTRALDLLTILGVSAGCFFYVAGTVGLLRFPDALTRMHALTKADNLGLGLIVLGVLPQAAGLGHALKLVSIWLFAQVSGAVASQLIAGAVLRKRSATWP
jgi:multicomponent Na+:H+ antiporter subunit G